MEFKDYYATLGVTKTSTEKEIKQAPSASWRASSTRTSTRATRPPRRSSRRSTRPTRCSAMPRSARSTTSSAPTGGCTNRPGRSRAAAIRSPARRRGRLRRPQRRRRTMTPEEMEEMFGDQNPFSDFFTTFFGGAAASGAGAGTRCPRRRPQSSAPGPRRRARDRADARGRLQRRDAPAVAAARRPGADRRRAHSGRRRRRLAGPRRGEGEHGVGGAAAGDLYLRVRLAPHPQFERKGRDLYVKVPVPVDDRGARRRGGRADARRQAGAAARSRR